MMTVNRQQLWERSSRLFLTLTKEHINDIKVILHQIIENIISNPEEDKYRILRYKNTSLKRRIFDRSGGLDFILATGFQFTTTSSNQQKTLTPKEEEEKLLIFKKDLILYSDGDEVVDDDDDENSTDIQILSKSLQWLDSTLDTCLQLCETKSDTESAAESIIQLQLPTGQIVYGGFLVADTLGDIRSFAQTYFQPEKISSIHLREPSGSDIYKEEDYQKTLQDLKLLPRAKLLVTCLSIEEAKQRLDMVFD